MIKSLERIKFKRIRSESSLSERECVTGNVENFLSTLDKKKWINKFFAIYWPLEDEVDLRGLRKKYPLALPKCNSKKRLDFYIWDEAPLVKDQEGIFAPNNTNLLNPRQISHIFVPCLSVDKKLNRLGYGGGYYDKLRSNEDWKLIPCIGVLTNKCLSKNLLTKDIWDIPLSGFITNNELLI
tara:strand:+ start:479 stop:1024 length:546 start_codon:yes stop_codon:yes gene_type:complete